MVAAALHCLDTTTQKATTRDLCLETWKETRGKKLTKDIKDGQVPEKSWKRFRVNSVMRKRGKNYTNTSSQSKQLLHNFSPAEVDFTVASPIKMQNDSIYVQTAVKKDDITDNRLLQVRSTFSRSVMVSVAMSKLGHTDLIFVQPGVKVNGVYYRDVQLQKMPLAIH